ncbi:MAG TPA: penicillin-binding protein 1C, partial [Burkholderiaceae bacterium]
MRKCWSSLSLLVVCGAACTVARAVPSFAEVRAAYRTSDTLLLDRHGAPLQAQRTDMSRRAGAWVALQDISPAMRNALLLSEDKRFYEHAGVDWQAAGAAAWANLWNTRTRGASTVTMQLAGLLDAGLATPRGGRSLLKKIGQAGTAMELEQSWSKAQILEAYLNLVGFRGEVVGIGALASTLFGKYASGLDKQEAAIAAALIRSPAAKPTDVGARACGLLNMAPYSADCAVLKTATQVALEKRDAEPLDRDAQLAPHFARHVLATLSIKPTSLKSTLDAGLQRFASDTLRRHLTELRDRHVEDGAVIVIDNASGEVLAWVGSSGPLSQAAQVDGVLAPRQAGSTLKPFLYEQAIEAKWLTAASLIDDSPATLTTQAGLYIPQNYDHEFKGPVSLRTALGSSLNVPAVRTLVLVTPERFAQRLKALGLPLQRDGGYYGYSLALGSAEVTLASLANAYRALANGGVVSPLRMQAGDKTKPSRRVMNEAASFIVSDVLSDREARVPTFGLDNALSPRYWAAVKTGTSKDMRDNWCVGFGARYTVGVWVGNASGEPMWDVSGVSGAAPVWRAVMDELQRRDARAGLPAKPPKAPAAVARASIRFAPAVEPPREEWFLAGTAQRLFSLAGLQGTAGPRIAAPADKTLFALDPDIPPQAQKLRLAAAPGALASWSWRMDGKRLGPAREMHWPLWPG